MSNVPTVKLESKQALTIIITLEPESGSPSSETENWYGYHFKNMIMANRIPLMRMEGSVDNVARRNEGAAAQESSHGGKKTGKTLHYRNASDGYWVAFLLPVAIYISDFSLQRETITAVTIIAINSFLLCVFHYLELNFFMVLQRLRRLIIVISGMILLICLAHGGNIYEVASYLALNFTFPYLFYNLVKQHPRSFSFGEGVLVASGFIYRFWGASQGLPFPNHSQQIYELSEEDLLTMCLQLLFFGTVLGARVVLLLQKPWKLFILEEMLCLWSKYCVMAFFARIPTQNDEVVVFLLFWPAKFLFATPIRVRLMFIWAVVSLLTGIYFLIKAFYSQRTTSVDRKVFHLAIVMVFLPGVALDHSLIYCCSSVVFFVFILVEALRVLRFEMLGLKIGLAIDDKVRGFRDHQDSGRLLLTPIYLLVGCALPIWLTDIDEKNHLKPVQYAACLAGVLSIGVGDTFASIGGTLYGRTRWKDSRKTIEGTVCSIIAQVVFVMLILLFDIIPYDTISVVGLLTSIGFNAVIEGTTDQIDNLVLPLVTFIMIHGVSVVKNIRENNQPVNV